MASNFFISEACMALKPNNGVKVTGGNITWADPSDIPTNSAINTKATELENAEPLPTLFLNQALAQIRLTNSLKKTLRGETHQLKHVIETRYRANGTQFGE